MLSSLRSHYLLASGLVFGALVATLLLAVDAPLTSGEDTGPAMELAISDPPGVCAAGVCELAPGADFTVTVDITQAPVEGYIGANSYISFGEQLTYNMMGQARDDILWPDCEPNVAVRQVGPTVADPTFVLHGCLTGLLELPVSTHTGPFITLSFSCSAEPSSSQLRLLPLGTPGTSNSGAAFAIPPANNPQFIAAKTNDLTVFCGDAPSPTPEPTVTPGGVTDTPVPTATPTDPPAEDTPTPTQPIVLPTATPTFITIPGPCGDINGDGLVNSLDALFVLQFSAGMIFFLPNSGDVDGNGIVNALDALHILWVELNLGRCF